ncbi:dipeptidase [Mesorhizobium sp. INR15]|uniref:dipeptidase n=1 Tax=Mesorhizobium sp. INR15 TaxID=2654248 RepID=UPI0018965203|nr:membrane dipeptidase [Mesorhizobium sp. INR15]QPC94887.1 peptidase M19 [Mesorhizobium sp. INR15]
MTSSAIIRESVVWESAVGWTPECLDEGPAMLARFGDAGFSFLSLTIGADWDRPEPTLRHFAQQRRWFENRPDTYRMIETVADIRKAKADGKVAIGFHFQGAGPLGYDPALVSLYYKLGIRWMILAYNTRNPLGDGCHEPENAGLSLLGRAFVKEMNRAGMMVDASHAGIRTSLDIIEFSEKPVVFSHSNARAIKNHERNITDEQILAAAKRGGVIGINSIGAFVNDDNSADVAGLLRHIDHIVQMAGPNHVGLGLDVVFYQDFMTKLYDAGPMMAQRGYPRPPWADLKPELLPDLVQGMIGLGYGEAAIKGVLGENFLRVAAENWI